MSDDLVARLDDTAWSAEAEAMNEIVNLNALIDYMFVRSDPPDTP